MSSRREEPPVGERRYTLMLVPEGGRGAVRQVSISLRHLRGVLIGMSLMLVLSVAGAVWLVFEVPKRAAYVELAEENLLLKERLQEVEATMDEVESLLERLRMYDATLEGLPKESLPNGFGPLDDDEVAALGEGAWSVVDALGEPILPGELGDPMDEPSEPPRLLEKSFQQLDAVELRSQRLNQILQVLEPRLALLAESAEDYRSMLAVLPSTNPVPKGLLTSGFGYRRSPFTRRWKFHSGIDLAAPRGTPIYAPGPGEVVMSRWNSGYGRMIEIDHGYGIVSRFAHNARLYVREGDRVERGQLIATIGMTGQTTGPHLHYEITVNGERVDPLFYIPREKLQSSQ